MNPRASFSQNKHRKLCTTCCGFRLSWQSDAHMKRGNGITKARVKSPLSKRSFLELLQHKWIMCGGKRTRGGVKVNNCGNPSFARGAVSDPREFCVTHCPGRPGQCLFPAVSREWHPTADCLGKNKPHYFIFCSTSKDSAPPSSSFHCDYLLPWFFKGSKILECSGRSTKLSVQSRYLIGKHNFHWIKYILCCSSAQLPP